MNIVDKIGLVKDPKMDFLIVSVNSKRMLTMNQECVLSLPNSLIVISEIEESTHLIKYENGCLIDVNLKCYVGKSTGNLTTYNKAIHKQCRTHIDYIEGTFWCPICNTSITRGDLVEHTI